MEIKHPPTADHIRNEMATVTNGLVAPARDGGGHEAVQEFMARQVVIQHVDTVNIYVTSDNPEGRDPQATCSLTHLHVSAGPLRAATRPAETTLWPGLTVISNLSWGLSSPQRWESDWEGRLCCLGVDALGDHAALGDVSRAGPPATVSGAGFVP